MANPTPNPVNVKRAFAGIMTVMNGIVGLCLLWGGARHHEQGLQIRQASAALAVPAALTILTLVLPNVATSEPGPSFSTSQIAFAGIVSLLRPVGHPSHGRYRPRAVDDRRIAFVRPVHAQHEDELAGRCG